MKKIYIGIVLAFFAVFTFSSCNNDKNKDDKELNIVCHQDSYQLALSWANAYMQANPELTIVVSYGDINTYNSLKEQKLTIGFFPNTESEDTKTPICKDALMPVISNEIPYISSLVQRGLCLDDLKLMWQHNDSIQWIDFVDDSSAHTPISIISHHKDSEANGIWAEYLGMDSLDNGKFINSQEEIFASMRMNPFSICFSSSSKAFNPLTGFMKEGFNNVPIDLDCNKWLDDSERKPYNSLEYFNDNIKSAGYPEVLIRTFSFIYNDSENEFIQEFLNWCLVEKGNLISSKGFAGLL